MMYVKLKKPYFLRGYIGLPYLLVNGDNGTITILKEKEFQVLDFCDGQIDFDVIFLTADQRTFLNKLQKEGYVEISKEKMKPLDGIRKYKKANNHFIQSVHWSVTGHCNLKCKHCYMSAPDYKYHDLSTKECFEVIEQFREAGVLNVTITGGEPFTRKDIFDILDKIYDKRMGISEVFTNGLLLNETILDWFIQRGKRPNFVLSFDCVGCHDWMRGVANVEEPTIKAIKLLRKKGFPVMIETEICKENSLKLMETYELLKSLDIQYWKTSLVFNAGKWKESNEETIEEAVLYEEYLRLIGAYTSDGAPFTMQLDGFFCARKGKPEDYSSMYARNYTETSIKHTSSCLMCRIHPYLLPDGTFLPCASMTDSEIECDMPNIKETTLSEIYRTTTNPFFKLSRIHVSDVLEANEECKTCQYRYECGGGCLALSLFAGNGVMGYSPILCYFFKNDYRKKIKNVVETNLKNNAKI